MKLVIDRSKWLCGPRSVDPGALEDAQREGNPTVGSCSVLLDPAGRMCCLGFLGRACDIPDEALLDEGTPCEVAHALARQWPVNILDIEEWDEPDEEGLSGNISDTILTGALIDANDSCFLTDEERESKVRVFMAQAGVEVEFVGEYEWTPDELARVQAVRRLGELRS